MRVEDSGPLCRFAYDGDGVRRKRLDVNGTIHYVGAYERNVGNGMDTTEVITKYYAASFGRISRLIALRKGGTLYYVGTDHLGSTIRVADSSFSAVDGMRYKPFGGDRDSGANLKTDHKFTSQIEDVSIGLYWYGFRAYDPAIGRFVAPDTIVPTASNPQSLNRYAYTLNNPLRYTDPTGHDVEDWFDESWQQEFRDAHGGANPTEGDYFYRLVTMIAAAGGDIASAVGDAANAVFNGFVNTPKETYANILFSIGSGAIGGQRTDVWTQQAPEMVGNTPSEYWFRQRIPTEAAKLFRRIGFVGGVAFASLDVAEIWNRYSSGTLSRNASVSNEDALRQDLAFVSLGFGATIGAALVFTSLAPAIAVGIGASLAVGGLRQAAETGDWSFQNLASGAVGAFGLKWP